MDGAGAARRTPPPLAATTAAVLAGPWLGRRRAVGVSRAAFFSRPAAAAAAGDGVKGRRLSERAGGPLTHRPSRQSLAKYSVLRRARTSTTNREWYEYMRSLPRLAQQPPAGVGGPVRKHRALPGAPRASCRSSGCPALPCPAWARLSVMPGSAAGVLVLFRHPGCMRTHSPSRHPR